MKPRVVALSLEIDRDWTWDGLSDLGLTIERDGKVVGYVQPTRTASSTALRGAKREFTRVVLHPRMVITDGNRTIGESGAIIEYILERYGGGRLRPARLEKHSGLGLQQLDAQAVGGDRNLDVLFKIPEIRNAHQRLPDFLR